MSTPLSRDVSLELGNLYDSNIERTSQTIEFYKDLHDLPTIEHHDARTLRVLFSSKLLCQHHRPRRNSDLPATRIWRLQLVILARRNGKNADSHSQLALVTRCNLT